MKTNIKLRLLVGCALQILINSELAAHNDLGDDLNPGGVHTRARQSMHVLKDNQETYRFRGDPFFNGVLFRPYVPLALLREDLKTTKTLKTVLINYAKIGDDGVYNLVQGLKQNSSVETLDLSCNWITDKGVKYLLELKGHKSLKRIILDDFSTQMSRDQLRKLQKTFGSKVKVTCNEHPQLELKFWEFEQTFSDIHEIDGCP